MVASWLDEMRKTPTLELEHDEFDDDGPGESAAEIEASLSGVEQSFPGGPRGGEEILAYNTETGRSSVFRRHWWEKAKSWTLPNGKRAFTRNPAGLRPETPGTIKCRLHPESPDFEMTRKAGVTWICNEQANIPPRANLPTPSDLDIHMRVCHPQASRMIREYEERQVAEEERAYRRKQMEWMQAQMDAKAESRTTGSYGLPCDDCSFVAKNAFGLQTHRRGKHGEV